MGMKRQRMWRFRSAGRTLSLLVVGSCVLGCLDLGFACSRGTEPQSRLVARSAVHSGSSEEAAWSRFAAWASSRGCNLTSVTLSSTGGVRGLVATRDIAAGENIITMPLGACIEVADASQEGDIAAPALQLLKLTKEQNSDLAPYLELLPSKDSPSMLSMPDFYTEEELDMLQCPPVKAKTLRRRQLCEKKAAESGFTPEEVQWALCTAAQRSFRIVSPIDGTLQLLLPAVDLLNHDSDVRHAFKVRWELVGGPVDALLKVVADSPIKAGDEVRICYGGNPYRPDGCGGDCHDDVAWTNEQYIQRYGFIDQSVGTTMVDGKWLGSEKAAAVREALAQTTLEEDAALLSDSSLSPAKRTAITFRSHLKRALAAQRAAEAVAAAAAAASPPKFQPAKPQAA